jgi:hypothetical protein
MLAVLDTTNYRATLNSVWNGRAANNFHPRGFASDPYSPEVPVQKLLQRQAEYTKQNHNLKQKEFTILQQHLLQQNLVDQKSKEDALERQRHQMKYRKLKEREEYAKRRALMEGESERLKALSEMGKMDVGDHSLGTTVTLETQNRFRSYDYLLKRITCHRFGTEATPNLKIRDDFRNTQDYQDIFTVLCTNEC